MHQLHDEIREAGILILIDLVNGDEVVVSDGAAARASRQNRWRATFVVRQLRIGLP